MAVNTWIVVGIIFFIALILILFGILIYMLFFRKVTVLTFDKNGNPFQVVQGTKKGKKIWFKKNNWTAKEDSIMRFGKRSIYLAQIADENSWVPYNLKGAELKADENWLEALNSSYRDSAVKFKFGIEKYKELISIIVTTCFICIMVLGAVKYTSEITPVEAEAIEQSAKAFENAAKYYAEGSKANQLIVENLDITPKKEIPK